VTLMKYSSSDLDASTQDVVGEDSDIRPLPKQDGLSRALLGRTASGADLERFGHSIAVSEKMRRIFSVLRSAALSPITILFEGESGTGKDALASSVHEESPRSSGPFVVVDCGALPPTLIESELFGHEAGSFTGARSARIGAFQAADRGTLFLDEVGELPIELQPKLLRFLETRTFKAVGGNERRSADVRVIAATNRRLDTAVAAGHFRSDLYYRLSVLRIAVPRLADRPEDIEALARLFLERMSSRGHAPRVLTPELLRALTGHGWPGNVRELRNAIERYALFGSLEPPLLFGADAISAQRASSTIFDFRTLDGLSYSEAKQVMTLAFHEVFLGRAVVRARGSITVAAEQLDLQRPSLSRMLQALRLRRAKGAS
jgi:transcriptional regulator with PAS, ATPase and Fis domain